MNKALEKREESKLLHNIRNEAYIDALTRGKSINLCVRGSSMYPFIKNYDALFIVPLNDSRPRIGDIVFVGQRSKNIQGFIIHRLVKISQCNGQRQYYTKGDNVGLRVEGPFKIEEILGRVVAIKRRDIRLNLRSPFSFFFSRFPAFLSQYLPTGLKIVNYFYCSILERSLLFNKIIKHIQFKDTLFLNSQKFFFMLSGNSLQDAFKRQALLLIQEGVRWNYFSELAISSGKTTSVLKNLRVLSSFIDVPNFVIKRLENARLQIIANVSRNQRQLLYILERFSKAKISVLVLKGPFLSERLYADISMRGANVDIDLLIKEADRKKCQELMESIGYKQGLGKEIELWCWHIDFCRRGSFTVDLHWDITMMNRSKERIEGLWHDARKISTSLDSKIIDYCQWSDEVLLLYLAVSLINSKGYRNFRGLFDIAALLESSRFFDWDALISKAYKFNANNSLYAGLIKTRQMLGIEAPQFVLDRLRPSVLKRLLINIFLSRSVFFENNMRRRILDEFLSYIFFELMEAATLGDLLRIIKRVIFPPRQILEASFNVCIVSNWRYAICILKRFFRIFVKAARLLFS